MCDGYLRLRDAIVRQAVEDLHDNSTSMRKDARSFFYGAWFKRLTGLDGKEMLKLIEKKEREGLI